MSVSKKLTRALFLLGTAMASSGVQASQYTLAPEFLQSALPEAPVRSALGDGQRSFGHAWTQSYFDATDNDHIDPRYLTDVSFTQRFSGFTAHVSGNHSPLRNQLGGGLTWRDTSLFLHSGENSEYGWTQNALSGFSDTFKAGFRSARNRWTDTTLSHAFRGGLELHGGQTRIDLKGRVNPDLYHTGFRYRGFSGDYALTRRNGVTIGQELSLRVNKGRYSLAYSQIRDINDHALHSLGGHYASAANRRVEFRLESGISPFTGVSDQRFLLRYSGSIGKPIRLAADGKPSETQPDGQRGEQAKDGDNVVRQQRSYKKHLIIAGSIIGGAVALASSSGNADAEQGGFADQHEAARGILNEINPKSVRENREYGGWIVRSGDSTYGYTSPRTGDIDSVSLGAKPGNATATYHTHGSADPRYDNEHFSPQDKRSDDIFGVDGYLATPSGAFLFYDYRSRDVTRLGTVAH